MTYPPLFKHEVVRRDDGTYRYVCGRIVNGLYFQAIGCRHLTPRDADKHTNALIAGWGVSPLRDH